MFIPVPFVKSITLGINIDLFCKKLLLSLCEEKKIDCFELYISDENFELSRKRISTKDLDYDIKQDTEYLILLLNQTKEYMLKFSSNCQTCTTEFEENKINVVLINEILLELIDILTNVYFFKYALNLLINQNIEEFKNVDTPKEMQDGIRNIEKFVKSSNSVMDSLDTSFTNFLQNLRISRKEYVTFQNKLNNIKTLIEKVELLDWHDILELN